MKGQLQPPDSCNATGRLRHWPAEERDGHQAGRTARTDHPRQGGVGKRAPVQAPPQNADSHALPDPDTGRPTHNGLPPELPARPPGKSTDTQTSLPVSPRKPVPDHGETGRGYERIVRGSDPEVTPAMAPKTCEALAGKATFRTRRQDRRRSASHPVVGRPWVWESPYGARPVYQQLHARWIHHRRDSRPRCREQRHILIDDPIR